MAAAHDIHAEVHDDEEIVPLDGTKRCSSCRSEKAHSFLRRQSSISRWRKAVFGITTLVAFVFGLGLAFIFAKPFHSTPRQLPPIRPGINPSLHAPNSWFNGSCGDSPATAHARGCQFNVALHAWLLPSCMTPEDHADEVAMYANTSFPWSNLDGDPVPVEQAMTGHAPAVLTNMDWHVVHCTYVWQRLHRALVMGTPLDSYTADYKHTTHCTMMVGGMVRGDEMSMTPTVVFAKYPTCA